MSNQTIDTLIGEPEVLEDLENLVRHPAWLSLKKAATSLQELQNQDGSLRDGSTKNVAERHVTALMSAVEELTPLFPHDEKYLKALVTDFDTWKNSGFGVPDFLDSLTAFHPQKDRKDAIRHLVVFPMYTQNGSTNRFVEAVLIEVIWPDFVAELEAKDYGNPLFVPIRFLDFTAGYDTNSAVLFPESVSMRAVPSFTWGGIFADREAARYRRVVKAASEITKLDLPVEAAEMLTDQHLTEQTFVMWDLIHDRTHMRGDLPFDPFMIKQRMPFFLYSLEELRCDLTAFRESVSISRDNAHSDVTRAYARRVQYAVIFDRIFRFSITGSRVRNYDGLGGQLLFAWMHKNGVLHWTDTQLRFDWDAVADVVVALGAKIDELYWNSIDRPKTAHWLAAYAMITETLTPHPASAWAKGLGTEILAGPAKGFTDSVLDDEFPLSMFFEALEKKMRTVIDSTAGITGTSA